MIKNYNLIKTGVIIFLLLFFQQSYTQTITVNSLEELLPYLKQDNVDVKLTPGTYSISGFDVGENRLFTTTPLFLFEGSNSTYDFTDVKLNINTFVFTKFGKVDVNELQILGNNNVLKNLTIEDIGTTAPSSRAQAIVIDGRDNRIEGFHVTVRGSYPYGYGDAFGKGGGSVIAHRKHSGVLIRGLRNHLKDCTIISRSYGHIVFMQAASYPIIEGCYIEGEMRTTDDMLAETSGPAYDVGFMTVWGYKLPAGYMMSLQEGGIRAYNAGTTYIDGVEIQRATDNPTVLNCTIKNARTGVTLAHANGTKYVEGCTVLGCENGYSIGSGTVVNCGADAIYGPVFKNTYGSDKGYNADITILPPSDTYYNGHDAIAYIGGSNHNLTFRSEITEIPSNLKIMVSGDLQGLRVLHGSNPSQNNFAGTNIVLRNLTNFPIDLHSDSSNITVTSCDTDNITDNGTNNSIEAIDCDSGNLALKGVASQSSSRPSDGFAANAIDGNTNGAWSNNSVSHTGTEENPWWQVDLGMDATIGKINIFNRTDGCCKGRLDNFTVYVIDKDDKVTFSKTYVTVPDPSVTVDVGDVSGRIVKIVLNSSSQALALAEVEVLGSSLSNEETIKNPISFYPNPIEDELTISLETGGFNVKETHIVLYNIKGQKILETIPNNSTQVKLNLSYLKAGVYLIKVSNQDKNIVKKVLKM